VIAAVERYLARRGVTVVGGETAAVVDRFLAARRAAAPGGAESTPAPAAAAPAPATVDFVCEDDVRRAIREGRRIHLAARAIITPSARDLAARHDVLVLPSGHQTA
jgi:pyruvate/2-oxoglutarate dehydrogenase complex dihydrolipoamide acyltransferase (E2) component